MSAIRFAAFDDLPVLLAHLSQNNRILAPSVKSAEKRSVVFEPWREGMPIVLEKATVPPREALLPQSEILFTYKKNKNTDESQGIALNIENTVQATSTVIFACRPCDARGFTVLDRPFLKGLFVDPYYKARRELLIVISLTCPKGCNTCFCHWVGGGPSTPEGSDILMTEIDNGFVFQALTPSGETLLQNSNLADGKNVFSKAEEVRKIAWSSLAPAPGLNKTAPQAIAAVFNNEDFWQKHASACLSCGACTYLCPACYCFNITDEGDIFDETGAKRLRSWDNCMSSLFTREASGHNPRAQKPFRLRNRIFHKFSTYYENWNAFSCNGCGRCIVNCPIFLDIRAVVLDAIAVATSKV